MPARAGLKPAGSEPRPARHWQEPNGRGYATHSASGPAPQSRLGQDRDGQGPGQFGTAEPAGPGPRRAGAGAVWDPGGVRAVVVMRLDRASRSGPAILTAMAKRRPRQQTTSLGAALRRHIGDTDPHTRDRVSRCSRRRARRRCQCSSARREPVEETGNCRAALYSAQCGRGQAYWSALQDYRLPPALLSHHNIERHR